LQEEKILGNIKALARARNFSDAAIKGFAKLKKQNDMKLRHEGLGLRHSGMFY